MERSQAIENERVGDMVNTEKLLKILKIIVVFEVVISILPLALSFYNFVAIPAPHRDPYPMFILTFLIIAALFVSMRLILFFVSQLSQEIMKFVIGLVVLLGGLVIVLEGIYMAAIYGNWKLYLPYLVIFLFYLLRFYWPVKGIVEEMEEI